MNDQSPNMPPVVAPENERLKAAFSYVLLWLTGLIMLLLEPQNKFIKFHAMQAIIYGLVLTLIGWIPCIGWFAFVVGWLYGLYGAYQIYNGKEFRLPYITEFVEKNMM
jgi:uncharacterized membrane protein